VNRSWRFVLVLAAVLVVVVLVAGNPDDDPGAPLSPDGTGPSGAKATVLLLEELGAEVEVVREAPPASAQTALLLTDSLSDDREEAVLTWVRSGGTLVVADPASSLTPPVAEALGTFAGLGDVTLERARCDVDDLDGVDRLELGGGALFEVASGVPACFGEGEQAFVVEGLVGDGRVVAVGGPYPFTNEGLDRADAAVLAARLLVPAPGTTVAFLDEAALGGGEDTLLDLVPDRVLLALGQLGLAFLVYVWFRARRAGRPVGEPQPTTLAGSELVEAVGRLLQQERSPERAAGRLQADLRRALAPRLGLPADAPLDDLVAVAERAGADPSRVRSALGPRPVGDDEALIALARDIDETRREVFHEHR
jgi:hypothetical protein